MALETQTAATRPGLLARLGALWRRAHAGDEVARLIVLAAATSIVLITGLLVFELWSNTALPRRQLGWGFLTSQEWNPVAGEFGALPFIYGTAVTSALALVLAVPLGLGCAIFLSEMAPRRLSDVLTFLIELLAAVPSVIYGLLGMFVLVPILKDAVPFLQATIGRVPLVGALFSGTFYGVSVFSAGVVLAVMIVPFIVSVSREVLLSVPRAQREGSLALGATRWETTWHVVVPYARSGIVGSVFLALARALGETMAVTMVIGNNPQIKASLLAPGYTIAAVVANEFTEATEDLYIQVLIELGLVLFALTIIINALARILILATTARGKGGHA